MQCRVAFVAEGVDLDDDVVLRRLSEGPFDISWSETDGNQVATVFADANVRDPVELSRDIVDWLDREVGVRILRIDDELVAVSDIAHRFGLSRETVRLWTTGRRGPGGFPRPRGTVGGGTRGQVRVWAWSDVSEWLTKYMGIDAEYTGLSSDEVAIVNHDLAYRNILRSQQKGAAHMKVVKAMPVAEDGTDGGMPPNGGVDPTGPIFVVHGHNSGRANEVARVLCLATSLETIILHEQPNRGLTIIEKFERHASSASFGVVILTGDDEGRLKDEPLLKPRGRQNVIFEMGFFFALLGREHVAVLVDPGVERPSDISGIVYIELDRAGAWKYALAREAAAAGLSISYDRIP